MDRQTATDQPRPLRASSARAVAFARAHRETPRPSAGARFGSASRRASGLVSARRRPPDRRPTRQLGGERRPSTPQADGHGGRLAPRGPRRGTDSNQHQSGRGARGRWPSRRRSRRVRHGPRSPLGGGPRRGRPRGRARRRRGARRLARKPPGEPRARPRPASLRGCGPRASGARRVARPAPPRRTDLSGRSTRPREPATRRPKRTPPGPSPPRCAPSRPRSAARWPAARCSPSPRRSWPR